ncbi:hypothetical protein UR09_01525 [Candidatus Nitromaritima sp. SCGC AAA799-A02]|nr:hypothetical protein UR09_01525 [Candidatus Nitromaritima sp. SCGC AAA799-A02]
MTVLFLPAVSLAQSFDFTEWDILLKKYVSPRTIDGIRLNAVDYGKLKTDPGFSRLVGGLKKFSPAGLKSREEKLAFWINIYNVFAVKMVVDHYPLKSIRDVGSLFRSVWKRPAGIIGGREYTLHEIEHGILRKMGEPRIHAAIVCASVSCPDLLLESFSAGKLEEQLDNQMKTFLGNPGKGMQVDAGRGRVTLSSIFDWFEGDFEPRGGVLAFIKPYVSATARKVLGKPGVRVSYMDYNWKVNESAP